MSKYNWNELRIIWSKPRWHYILLIFFIYIIINFFVSGFYDTLQSAIRFSDTVNWVKLGFSIVFSILIGIFIAMNVVLAYTKYQTRQDCKKSTVLSSVGVIGGFATGVCPLCVTGLFPLIFGFFGITFSFALLPFGGMEVQVVVILMLVISILLMMRKK